MASTPPRRTTNVADETASLLASLQRELVGLKVETAAKIASLEDTIANLAHENTLLKRRLYGNKTEHSHTSECQLALGDLLAGEAQLQKDLDAAVEKAEEDAGKPDPPQGPRAKPTGRRDLFASNLPRCVWEILDEELEAEGCRRIGFEESKQLMFRRGGFAVFVKRVAKYEVIANDGSPTVVTVPSPETLFPRALLHTSAIAHVVVAKFGLGVPHYRLEQDLTDQGVALDRGTMGRYVEQVGNTLGATIVHAMWQDAITNGQVISTDATGALIQPATAKGGRPQACKKGHFFTAVVDCDAILFAYTEHHTSAFVQQLFAGFSGYLQADASAVYNILEHGAPKDNDDGVRLVGCTAHLRRYFFEAALCRHPVGLQGLLRIRAIYAADHAVQRAPAVERQTLRDRHVRPLMASFFDWARAARDVTHGRNLATKALGYAVNQEVELMRVLDDIKLPLDNTRSERALRKIVVGRKSWMFYGSDMHAEAAAAIFSVMYPMHRPRSGVTDPRGAS